MAARGDGVEGDERVWVVVVGRGEPGWRLSVEGEFGCELELGAAMVAAVRLGCASRELCVGKKNKGEREGGVGCFGSAREARQLLQAPGRGWPRRERRLAGRGRRRAWRARAEQRGRACALEWGGDGAQQGSSGAAAGSASARGSGAASASVRTRALCARGVNVERMGERERVLWSMILTRFKIKIFN